ncbi:molybdopterin molybdotransferase MoeA [Jannaschia ovalis]|uniref:Molybdopterin molybdenumtransferase n=1 Tax=Jannaschia ovalis TaxID=3038773 RepID=A0ABY8LBK4_9RHOB|nr:molybdopterin molybdotransferase MoeA [Jannaschia sp. GRR-S6-38]WGH78511.1 molybdopterin molybdotransferase MoeA [Jannaschia sp. GRR-S6-38]
MISVAAATEALLALVRAMPVEAVPLARAGGRVLAEPIRARHDQPPFPASAMDGYAVAADTVAPDDAFTVIGEAAAGHAFAGGCGPGQAVRIFTGAPLPPGATRVLIQEDVARDGDRITVTADPGDATHIRAAASDFEAGFALHPRRLNSRDVALAAAMGHADLSVRRAPEVAILMTGDELRAPGTALRPGEIVASNGYGLAAMLRAAGASPRLLPMARDTGESLAAALDMAAGADLVLTIGGASVGDHDLVAGAAGAAGMELAFHRVAMRPGKPLLAGRLGAAALVGLPGNPVSAMVCGVIFVLPMVRKMLGEDPTLPIETLPLAAPIPANGPREHYMRALRLPDGRCRVAERQDSALLSVLAASDRLVLRPPGDAARPEDDIVRTIPLPA